MKKFLLFLFLLPFRVFAIESSDIRTPINPEGIIVSNPESWSLVRILSYGEEFLLKVVLPMVVIGVTLYVAYELLTAEGDETKMKKAWKTVSFTAIGLLVIAIAYTLVSIIQNISF